MRDMYLPQPPYLVETPEQLHELITFSSTIIVSTDEGPVTVWVDEDANWHGIRPVTEDDGHWDELPESIKESLTVYVDVDFEDPDRTLPVKVAWHNGNGTDRFPSLLTDTQD